MPKLTEYNGIASLSASSVLLYAVDISGGSPVYGKISGSNLGISSGSGGFANPMTNGGDMIYQQGSITVPVILTKTDSDGNEIINAYDSHTEKIITGYSLDASNFSGSAILITVDVWMSMNMPGTPKAAGLYVRRDSILGAEVTSSVLGFGSDSANGHDAHFTISYSDTSPTSGIYVLTTKATSTADVDIWSDTRSFSLDYNRSIAEASRLPIGSEGNILSVVSGSPTWGGSNILEIQVFS